MPLNETHDISLESWVKSANNSTTDFPIQNLPFSIFRRKGSQETFRGGIAIGDKIIDALAASQSQAFNGNMQEYLLLCSQDSLNKFMASGKDVWSEFRLNLSRALRKGAKEEALLSKCLVDQSDVEFTLPCTIGDYTDFYTSIYHATSVGKLFRPDNPLLPNYKWIPIAYHGRSSSIGVSGQKIQRPIGQIPPTPGAAPILSPTKRLDYEVEMGVFIGQGNNLGESIAIDKAEDHVFGLCLFNDWSARDIQAWEYQPLGPFLAKNFASTISPWIVTFEALEPFKHPFDRAANDPEPLSYLQSIKNQKEGAFDINLECYLNTEKIRDNNQEDMRLSVSNFKHSYWTINQMVAHHSINGCNLRPGDLLGSGTQSGPEPEEAGSLLELTDGGKKTIELPNGETRTFLADGDKVILRGWCEKKGLKRIGFGETYATILPSPQI